MIWHVFHLFTMLMALTKRFAGVLCDQLRGIAERQFNEPSELEA